MQGNGTTFAKIPAVKPDDMDKKLGELEDAVGKCPRLLNQDGVCSEKLGVVLAHHRSAGAGGNHDRPGFRKQGKLAARNGSRLIGKAAGVGRLTAADLLIRDVDRYPFAFQQTHGVNTGFRRELIDQARGEQIGIGGLRRVLPGALSIEFQRILLLRPFIGKLVLPFDVAKIQGLASFCQGVYKKPNVRLTFAYKWSYQKKSL
jgi:hypothetical protein